VRTTLGELGAAPIRSTAVIVIGEVAALDLGWFERRPLFGRRVVVTRARSQASELVERLVELGAEVIEAPTIAIVDPPDRGRSLRDAAARVASFGWVVFTSTNAVERFTALLRDGRAFGAARVAAIGPATADALRARNIEPDLVPARAIAEGLLEEWPTGEGSVLVPQSALARPTLAAGLTERGWKVEVVDAYTTLALPARDAAAVVSADAITFTASSTVTNFVDSYGVDALPKVVVSIGPATSSTAAERGIAVTAEADPHTLDGLIGAVLTVLGSRS
jgi:uroporphyrinogen III methyltransferase/synthase